jgi:anti-anti-sigma factor
MAFNAEYNLVEGDAVITLVGELDASSAPDFKSEIEKAASSGAPRLVLRAEGLEYMSSAGLRVLIFARQKMGAGVDIYVVGAPETILSTIEKTGFHHSVIIQDVYSPTHGA